MKRWKVWGALAIATVLGAGNANALMLAKTNLVELVRDADVIVVGTVTNVTDGIDDNSGLPYTEVTLSLEETIRGLQSDTYTFRQIGLTQPRLTADGTKMMAAAPAEIPRYPAGTHVLVFMGERASMTGLQSPIGLGYGKFVLGGGNATNDYDNGGVFQNVSITPEVATDNDNRILATTDGPVNQVDLLSLVRRAVQGNWTGNCQMWNTDEGTPSCGHSRRPFPSVPKNPTIQTNPTQTPTNRPRLGIK